MQQASANNLIRKQFLIAPRQIEKLNRLAREEHTSVAQLVRRAIDAYDPHIPPDVEAPELMELVSARLKEAIADTRSTRERLRSTLRKLGLEEG
ncbi:MAG: ribbon-helix-helix protein, CopG family [Thermodesulfobacteriota bacterium]